MKNQFLCLLPVLFLLLTACPAGPDSVGTSDSSSLSSVSSSSGGSSSSAVSVITEPGIYVATNGSDAASGTNAALPVKSLQAAIVKALAAGVTNIYVAGGVYIPGAGLNSVDKGLWISNSGIAVTGGFDAGFLSRSEYTVLDGQQTLTNVVHMSDALNVRLDGLVIANGKAYSHGGGLYAVFCSNLVLANCVISNNSAHDYGGGAYLNACSNVTLDCDFISNTTGQQGGGAIINYCINVGFYGNFTGNRVTNNGVGGALMISYCENIEISGSYDGNCAYNNSSTGGIYLNYATNCRIMDSLFINNWSRNPYLPGNHTLNLGWDSTEILVSNCLFSGQSNNAIAIEEDTEVTDLYLVENVFNTNMTRFLYYDFNGNNIVTNDSFWTNINVAAFFGAVEARDNRVTNF